MIFFLGKYLIGVLECHQLTPPNKIVPFFFSESKLCTTATKLPPLPLSILHAKFDNEKELCNMTDIDFVQLSQVIPTWRQTLAWGDASNIQRLSLSVM